MKCPNCGFESNGTFCAECGAPLKGATCKECNAPLTAGANFCTACGQPVHAGVRAGTNPAWYVAGAALLLLIGFLLWPAISGRQDTASTDGRVPISDLQDEMGGGAEPIAPQAALTGTPREQADRLFNRIMTERANGDTARAKFFLPMGIQAYGMAGELDADGLYHLSLLQALAGDDQAARKSAERILEASPNHLLGLAAAADAARAEGDTTAARNYYRKFLEVFDTESKKDLPEYRDHARVFPELRAAAEDFLK